MHKSLLRAAVTLALSLHHRPMKRLAVLFTLSASACGYTDPGEGSRTLFVEAAAAYEVSDNVQSVRVDVQKDLVPVTDAVVVVKDGETDESFSAQHIAAGRYRVGLSGYHRRLELVVEAGRDELRARPEGPGDHLITKPVANAVLRRRDVGDTLKIEWSTRDGLRADEVHLRLDAIDFADTLYEDTGSFDEISTAILPAGDYEVRVARTNETDLHGGVSGSKFEMSFGVENGFVLGD